MGGRTGPPILHGRKVTILESHQRKPSGRSLGLFTAKAARLLGLDGEVGIRITSSEELQELNRRFRRKNRPTDVLSFPAATPGTAGDIAISADIALQHAARLGHSLEAELKILILHGLLHLAGYDHESDEGQMQRREAALRLELKLPSGLIERSGASKRKTAPTGGRTVSTRGGAGR